MSSLDYYTHRCGRTGRAGRSGVSYVLFNEKDIPGLKVLRERDFDFQYQDYRKTGWVTVKPFDYKPTRRKDEFDEEVEKIKKRPVRKVKPGYKKKIQAEIDSVRKRQRRLKIKASIKQQQKERAKRSQRTKSGK